MGSILVSARMESFEDLSLARRGMVAPEEVRRVQVADAVVDPDVLTLSVPKRLIAELGLCRAGSRRARADELEVWPVHQAVRLTVRERECTCDVVEVPDDSPVLIGRVTLMMLDLVIDCSGRRLIDNPEHGRELLMERY